MLSRGVDFSSRRFGQITGNALGDLLLGFPFLTSVAHVDNPQQIRTESYNFFINDSYRVTPRLTLNGGLRYEYNSPPVDAQDRATIYDVATRSLVPVGTNGVPRSGFDADKNNFAPRVGVAWSLNEKTVLRGGYGVYYDQSPLAPAEALYFNSPFFDNNIFFSLPGLPLTLNNPFPSFFPFPLPIPRSRFSAICARLHAALELQRRTQLGSAVCRSRLRRLEGYEAVDGSRHQPAAAERVCRRDCLSCRARSAFRRHRPARVAREFELQRAASALSATPDAWLLGARVVHVVQVDRRRFKLLHAARAIQTSRRTVTTWPPSAGARISTSVTGCHSVTLTRCRLEKAGSISRMTVGSPRSWVAGKRLAS
jgi:hypothetical protein